MSEVDLTALRMGDELAYRAIVTEYHSALLRLAMIYSPSREIAEETVQETWMAVLRGLDTFAGRSSLRTWVCRILVNVARRRFGAETRSLSFATIGDDDQESSLPGGTAAAPWSAHRGEWARLPEDMLLSHELRDVVTQAVSQLPRVQREVITLRDIEGWSAAEVHELLGIQDSHQRVLLHRARTRVRQALQDYLTPSPA